MEDLVMKGSEAAIGLFSAMEERDFARAGGFLSDQLQVTGVAPEPLSKSDFLNVHRALSSGIPDLKFHHRIFKEDGDRNGVKVSITGTHTKEMTPPVPGLRNIPATGKPIKMPQEEVYLTAREGKITKIELKQTPGGGLRGLLKQIGVTLPEHAGVA